MKQAPSSPLANQIAPEKATAFLFYKPADAYQKQLLLEVNKLAREYRNLVVKPLSASQAAQYGVSQFPLVIVLDRRGRETGRAATIGKLPALFRKATNVARIDWAMEGEPSGEAVKRVVPIPSVEQLPGILRTMSLTPDAMMGIQNIANLMHFKDAALPRRQKEMVAAYVSALNKCKY